MKKIILILCLLLTVFLCSCDSSANRQNSTVDIEGQTSANENNTDKNNKAETEKNDKYLRRILEVAGEDFLNGKAALQIEDQVIFGETCAVFKIGTNTQEKFTTEHWIAVSENGDVFEYDVVTDSWSKFVPALTTSAKESIENCIYMLNEVYKEEFGVEYNDTNNVIKKAGYASEDAFISGQPPEFLFNMDEEVPANIYADPSEACYYPVTNFKSIEELDTHLRLYFTQWYIDNIRHFLDMNFFEHQGVLYLVRGGRGYGTTSINFDTLDASAMKNNRLNVGTLFFDAPDIPVSVHFVMENGSLKINSAEQINNYPLQDISENMIGVQIPDFLAFETYNNIGTATNQFVKNEFVEGGYNLNYFGDYYELLPQYIKLLEMQGFTIVMDGNEGFYMLEKYTETGIAKVNAYFMNEDDGVVIEIIVTQAAG